MQGEPLKPAKAGPLALCVVFAIVVVLIASGARAQGPHTPRCFAGGTHGESVAAILADAARWDCRPGAGDIRSERSLIRFAVPRRAAPPDHIYLRRARMHGLDVRVEDARGRTARRRFTLDGLEDGGVHNMLKAPLPTTGAPPVRVTMAIDDATNPDSLRGAALGRDDARASATRRGQLLVSLLCGVLILPLLFDLIFLRILRERFLLWHFVLAAAMLLTVGSASNLTMAVFDIGATTTSHLATLGFFTIVAAGAMFARDFIEEGRLHPLVRRLLIPVAIYALAMGLIRVNAPFLARGFQYEAHHLALIPVLALLGATLVDALCRGSRAALFQAIGWSPLLLLGGFRQLSILSGGAIADLDTTGLFYLSCALEVVATWIGVTDRMLTVRRQRDAAIASTRHFETLACHDWLTGLLNRRALESRFAALREEGFRTFALIDLDRFKAVNDRHGHQTGDDVLVACARALVPQAGRRNIVAARLGGEEFLLLLRGPHGAARAEAVRRAIPDRVARAVPGLDRPITASMGLVEIGPDRAAPGSDGDFAQLYAHADALLYQAKGAGRDCAMAGRATAPAPALAVVPHAA